MRHWTRPPRTRPSHRRGFTLIEAAVATVIVATGILGMVAAQQAWHRQNAWAERAAIGTRLGNEIREMTFNFERHDPVTGVSTWGPEANELVVLDYDDLDDFDGNFVARGDERLEVAQNVRFRDVVEEVVPAAPSRREGRRCARARRTAMDRGEVLEESARIHAHPKEHRLEHETLTGRQQRIDPQFHLDFRAFRGPPHVDEAERTTLLEHTGTTRGAGRPGTRHRNQVRFLPAGTVRRWVAHGVVEPAKPRPRRKRRGALAIEDA